MWARDRYAIAATRFEQLEKRPGLYLIYDNKMLKVASFGSEEKAKIFEEWLGYMLTGEHQPHSDEWMEDRT